MPGPKSLGAIGWRFSLIGVSLASVLTLAAASSALHKDDVVAPHSHADHVHGQVIRTPDDAYRPWPTPKATRTPVPGLLPDLRTEVPEEMYIQYHTDGRKLLRFETRVMNAGEGPIELEGKLSDDGEEAFATQLVEQQDGTTEDYPTGALSYSDQHGHWHLNNFALFELRPQSSAEDEDTQPVATQNKITFCLLDERRIRPLREDVDDEPEFLECDWQQQGISQGWSETYVAALPEQWVDITGLPDGIYTLHVTLDPDDILIESDQDNNAIKVDVEINGDVVTMLPERERSTPTPRSS